MKTNRKDDRRTEDFIGRQIYFKLSKEKLANSDIGDLTPGKLYTIDDTAHIADDKGYHCNILMGDYCLWLAGLTTWILKRK